MTNLLRLTEIAAIAAVLVVGSLATAQGGSATGITAGPQTPAMARAVRTSVWTGVYTTEQATRGRQAYTESCRRCHGDDLGGGQAGPSLVGSAFFDRWSELTLFDVFAMIQSSMPNDHHGFVSADAARDIVSLLLQRNGIPAGTTELPKETERLGAIVITRTPPRP